MNQTNLVIADHIQQSQSAISRLHQALVVNLQHDPFSRSAGFLRAFPNPEGRFGIMIILCQEGIRPSLKDPDHPRLQHYGAFKQTHKLIVSLSAFRISACREMSHITCQCRNLQAMAFRNSLHFANPRRASGIKCGSRQAISIPLKPSPAAIDIASWML